jgi:hypothetical protein
MSVGTDVEVGAKYAPPTKNPIGIQKKVAFWASNVFALLTGLAFGIAGALKLAGAMDHEVKEVMAPFFGMPPILMKIPQLAEAIGGFCLIGGSIATIVAKLDESKSNLLETLLLMDGIGLCTIAIGALFMHTMRSEPPPPLLIALVYTPLRFWYNDWTLPHGFKTLFFVFLGVNVVGLLSSVAMHFAFGKIA